ncbi:MAG TPA: carboxypeptidase-like regulatory domain-containing protein [Blastocatellia bacterium]|nr:carboxypeptidase-like regulatory domain-containing protein [Blastocatellia bacterium]
MSVRFLHVITILALLGVPNPAQQPQDSCGSPIKYVNNNQVDLPPLALTDLSGQVLEGIGYGKQAEDKAPFPKACLGLFSEQKHELIANAIADEEGRFKFKATAPGYYRLVVQADGLCAANISLRITRGLPGRLKARRLIVHMRPEGYDTCSYSSYK